MTTYRRWVQLNPTHKPTNGRSSCPIAADPIRDFVAIAGGDQCGSEWSDGAKWDVTDWTNFSTPAPWLLTPKPYREGLAMCYDPIRHEIVTFGGWPSDFGSCSGGWWCYSGQTVTYDGTTWTLKAPAHSPSPRAFSVMAWSPTLSKVVLYGGTNGGNVNCPGVSTCASDPQSTPPNGFIDTWAWDGTDWTQLTPIHHPEYLTNVATLGSNIYGWGGPGLGTFPFNPSHALWKFDGTDWTVVTTATDPGRRFNPGFGYWSALGKIIMFGGLDYPGPAYLSDVWGFDGTDWTAEQVCGSLARTGQGVIEDPVNGWLLSVGGNDGSCLNSVGQQTWALEDLTAADATTGAASGNVCSVAILNGTVNPHGLPVTVFFDYGTSTAYGSTISASPSSPTGSSPVAVTGAITGLTPGTTYHFRARVVIDGCSTVDGADATFVEGACAAGKAQLTGHFDLNF